MPNIVTTSAATLKSDLGKRSANKPLCRCLSWLYSSFPEIKKIALDGSTLESFSAAKQRADGIAGIKTYVYISDGGRLSRSKFANKVLSSFDDGPLFVDKPIEKGAIEFIWHGGKDRVEKNVANGKLQQIDYGKSVADKLSADGGSDASRYPIAYYSFNGSLDDLKKILKKVKSFDGKAKVKEALEDNRIVAKCILDLTMKGDKEGTNKESEISDAGDLLDMLKPSKLTISKKTVYGKEYLAIEAIDDRESTLKSIRSIIDKDVSAAMDKAMYSVMFNAILSNAQDGIRFSMKKLKESRISKDSTFIEGLHAQKTYGAVMAELLVPFLLLCGYKSIDGKEILKGLPTKEKVVSVEFPNAKNNVLTDYDTVFANTSDGRQYAISAKWTEGHNSPGLFTLLYDNIKMFGKKVVDEYVEAAGKKSPFSIAVGITKKDGNHKGMPGKLMALAENSYAIDDSFMNRLAKCVTYDGLKKNEYAIGTEYKENDRKKLLKKFDEEIGSLYRKVATLVDLFPYSVPIVCDKKMAASLNENKEFLLTLYNFMFGYYGKDVEFQQIQMNDDLSLKYIEKNPDVTTKNVSEYIKIESVSSIKKQLDEKHYFNTISIAQPLRVALLK